MSLARNWSEIEFSNLLPAKWQLYYAPSVGSTNDWLKELGNRGAPAGTITLTDFQNAGRGRLNRQWQAPAGTSLLFSLLLRPQWPANHANWLTMLAGLAVCEGIEQHSQLILRLKWPNDVGLMSEANIFYKLGGILLECQFTDDQLSQAIIGIGLNVNIRPEDLPQASTPPTSLLIQGQQPMARLPLLATILERLHHYYQLATAGRSPQPAWNERLITRHRPVQVSGPQFSLVGMAEGTDPWGQLLVRDEKGVLHTVPAGDVSLRPLDKG